VAGRTQLCDALLLRAVDYGESDRIVTLLTRELGKVALIARGARRSKRRFGAALEPYALLRAEVGLGRGEVGRLAQAQIVKVFPGILRDLGKIELAGAALALVRDATPDHQPDPRVLDATIALLESLEEADGAREELLLAFQARLLALIGLAAGLDVCGHCGRRAPEGQAALFDPSLGAISCRACGGGPLRIGGVLRGRLATAQG
jgi:DNA repair protein RecO (recombination protein O)